MPDFKKHSRPSRIIRKPGGGKNTGFQLPEGVSLACPPGLPICRHWDALVTAVGRHQVVVVTGETGSGKTTQLPKICLAAGRGRRGLIACTQPRRVAAVSVSARLAEELGPAGSTLVGYRIRFRDGTSPETRIKFVTDGMLLAEVQGDPTLEAYDTIIVDEAHERSLNIDFLLGLLRRLLPQRPDLSVVITSATLNIETFTETFPDAPVIRVSGRGYPVDIRYRPPESDDGTDITPVEQVIEAVEEIRRRDRKRDILVFLPTEKDIHETTDLLKSTLGDSALVLPMYGRLPAADQHRIFRPSARQKIVVATNVAETSITVPGIKYVVDSGLARISRYSIRSRTRSLPVSPVSRSSADQRAGRAGRMEPGVCIRLYSEDDYEQRPQHTPPEILRSNLAEVILRLAAMNLGPVADFPFVDVPSPQAVREGFSTLRELGAIDASGSLTRMGRLMAKLPLDPRISRMVLQARRENALREVLVIASALSIQDVRERPPDRRQQADEAHGAFRDERSDFLTFLNMWNAFHRELAGGASRNRMRKYCRQRFLSYNRMREWQDVHDQLSAILRESGRFTINREQSGYAAVHRSIVSGFLGQIALNKKGAQYQAARGKEVCLFPGSGLYRKRPQWIVAAEFVRTSQLFARTVAAIEPAWLEDLAGDLCTYSHFGPRWEKKRGEVIVWEKVTLFGLPVIERRRKPYARINPEESREIFIREGLMEGKLRRRMAFLRHNMDLVSKVSELEQRTRSRGFMVDEEVIYSFYDRALAVLERTPVPGGKKGRRKRGAGFISDEAGLAGVLRVRGDDSVLRLTEEDILKTAPNADELVLFPGHIDVAGHRLALRYRFDPGNEADGISVTVPLHLLPGLPATPFEWLVPGLLPEKVLLMLKSLPKQVRKQLVPLSAASEKVSARLDRGRTGLHAAMEEAIRSVYGISVSRSMWPQPDSLPDHLRMRFRIIDRTGRVLEAGRDLAELKRRWSTDESADRELDALLEKTGRKWEVSAVTLRTFPEVPGEIPLGAEGGLYPHKVYPGLVEKNDAVDIRLFLDPEKALAATRSGARRLMAQSLSREFTYLSKHCLPEDLEPETFPFFKGRKELARSVLTFIRQELLGSWDHMPTKDELTERVLELQKNLYRRALPLVDLVEAALKEFERTLRDVLRFRMDSQRKKGAAATELEEELRRLVPEDFPSGVTAGELKHLPRYLKSLSIRAQRAYAEPTKDHSKAERVRPYVERLAKAEKLLERTSEQDAVEALESFRTLVREYRVSIFSPELRTAVPVSAKRLNKAWERLERLLPERLD